LRQVVASEVVLPMAADTGGMSLAQALRARRSTREFGPERLSLEQISQLAWSAQGITHGEGYRTAPSAGALYPLELYVVTPEGLYHYSPRGHRLTGLGGADVRPALQRAAFGQDVVARAAVVFVLAAVYARTESKYGTERGSRYVHIEVGHAAENLLLEAAALGLGAVPVGAFDDGAVQRALNLPEDEKPLYLIPVGKPRR
jgi:SagB-type dehydrogenase family enzyme